jgi:hypothetical protein
LFSIILLPKSCLRFFVWHFFSKILI